MLRLTSQAIAHLLDEIEQAQLNINSMVLLQDGAVAAQFWRKPYREGIPQLLFSLSKSFTSIAAGIASDNGYFDLQDKVISFFPDKLPKSVSANLAQMSIHHLLSMNTGHHDNIYGKVASQTDWVQAFLAQDVQGEPGSCYRYSTHATYMVAAIIEKVTGENLVDFLMPRLFTPLGIPRPTWETCPLGITAGGMGLSISTEGIAAFGQMLADQGVYKGRTIVSEAYIRQATTEQSDNRLEADPDKIDSAQGYGYQLFLCRRGCYMGNGAFGQLCFVAPEHRLVIAATSSMSTMKQLQRFLDLVYKHVLDPVQGGHSNQMTEEGQQLQRRLAEMTYRLPLPQPVPASIPDINQTSYVLDNNPQQLSTIGFTTSVTQIQLQMTQSGQTHNLTFDYTTATMVQHIFIKDLAHHEQQAVTYAVWRDAITLELTLYYIETPYVVTYTISFFGSTIKLHFHINVSFMLEPYTVSGSKVTD